MTAPPRRWVSDDEFRDYYYSPDWQYRRAKYFQQHGRRCKACGTTKGPHDLHHLSYENWGAGGEPNKDLMALCRFDHKVITWLTRRGIGRRTASWGWVALRKVFPRR